MRDINIQGRKILEDHSLTDREYTQFQVRMRIGELSR